MKSARSPPWRRRTPTNTPELQQIWENLYRELHIVQGIGKSKALEMTGRQFGVSRQTVMYHIFPAYKNSQKKRPSRKWNYEKQHPDIHRRLIEYKLRYMSARRHINDLIRQSYQRSGPKEEMTLKELSDGIYEVCGVSFHPDTISGLVKRFESEKSCRLLVEASGCDPPRYRLWNLNQ